MQIVFYIAAAIAIISTVMVISGKHAVHALLYLIVSLLAVAVIFYMVGAPFVAVLEVIIYAGAIMVLFIFVVMMLNLGPDTVQQEKEWLQPRTWTGPSILSLILLTGFIIVSFQVEFHNTGHLQVIGAKTVSKLLLTKYLLGVELAGMLLMGGVVGAYHLGRKKKKILHRYLEDKN